jgi:glutamyl-tRNA synthetase
MTQKLIDRLFPNVTTTVEDYEKKYPPRNLPAGLPAGEAGAIVSRIAPSPTGFMHIGNIYTAMLAERLAHKTGGVFFLRIEDTDEKREVEGAVQMIIDGLKYYGVKIDEGVTSQESESGAYGPYTQSKRREIYQACAKYLVEHDLAYPCFATEEELSAQSKEQVAEKLRPGYYGKWAIWRDASEEKIKEALDANKPFVIRMKAGGKHENKVPFHDAVKGTVQMPENDLDIVLLKSDGQSLYHFAHVVDDHFMRTTHVIRTNEWFSSLPIHAELFKMFSWDAPIFCHPSPIEKMDGVSRRKLSKRKDPEAGVAYYQEAGYPALSIQEYLLNLLNSNFEDWRRANPSLDNREFKLSLDKVSPSGALFDIIKLTDVSKETIARMTAEQVYGLALMWAEKYDSELTKLLTQDKAYAVAIFNIERGGDKTRKDIAKWSDVKQEISYFYDELFKPDLSSVQNNDAIEIVKEFLITYNATDTKEVWLDKVRTVAEKLGYARDTKTYKASPEKFKGTLGQVTNVLRVLITGRTQSPDLYEVMKVLGTERVEARLSKI